VNLGNLSLHGAQISSDVDFFIAAESTPITTKFKIENRIPPLSIYKNSINQRPNDARFLYRIEFLQLVDSTSEDANDFIDIFFKTLNHQTKTFYKYCNFYKMNI